MHYIVYNLFPCCTYITWNNKIAHRLIFPVSCVFTEWIHLSWDLCSHLSLKVTPLGVLHMTNIYHLRKRKEWRESNPFRFHFSHLWDSSCWVKNKNLYMHKQIFIYLLFPSSAIGTPVRIKSYCSNKYTNKYSTWPFANKYSSQNKLKHNA